MNMGTFRSSGNVTWKFCRVCGTSLFSPEDGWEADVDDKEVSVTNMYNRELHGRGGKTVDVSVAAINNKDAKRWIEVVEHIFLDDALDGVNWLLGRTLPMYPTIVKQLTLLGTQEDQILRNAKTQNYSHDTSKACYIIYKFNN